MVVQRLPRNTRVKPARLSLVVEEDVKVWFHQLAEHAGVSDAALFEQQVRNLRDNLTDRGLPTWWPAPTPNDGELDIDAA